ncbi:MAG TPA: hypothetical protein VND19_13305 [Acetobacteraceae bacterium]|nr:hypothetical protein [Acetobacteraceae bacterium]
MSSVQAAARAPAFFELFCSGKVTADEIDDFVGRWHADLEPWAKDMPLHEYLGLTDEEYGVWVCDPYALPHILAARRSGRELAVVMAERLDAMRRVSDPLDRSILFALGNWVKARSGQ